MNKATPYRYWGFIAYSAKDAAIANRLHRALESYPIPRSLVGRHTRDREPVPRNLSPIFWTREELPLSADLDSSVREALRESRYLIVVCSPDAARSRWVNEEIRFFRALGREDRVLPIVIQGKPEGSDDPETVEDECFPPALRFRLGPDGQLSQERCKPLFWDLRPGGDGWKACVLKAVGGMTGFGLNAFVKREGQRRKRRLAVTASILGAVLAVAGISWDYSRTKTAHFAQLTERFGVPRGTEPLRNSVAAHRSVSYRVESSRFKTRRIVCINSAGSPVEPPPGPSPAAAAICQFRYGEDGKFTGLDLLSPQGELLARTRQSAQHSPDGTVLFVEILQAPGDSTSPSPPDPVDAPDAGRVLAVHMILYGKNGLPQRRLFLDENREPQPNGNGAYGEAYRYDRDRLLMERSLLGPDGQAQPGNDGVGTTKWLRGLFGEITRTSLFSSSGKPVAGPQGWHQEERFLDQSGNVIERRFLDTSSNLAPDARGISVVRCELDWKGFVREEAFFDSKGVPILSRHLCAKETTDYDDRGWVTGRAHFGLNGEPVTCSHGFHRFETKLDADGKEIETTYFGIDNQPLPPRDSFALCPALEGDLPIAAAASPRAAELASVDTSLPAPAAEPEPEPAPMAAPAAPELTLSSAPAPAPEPAPAPAMPAAEPEPEPMAAPAPIALEVALSSPPPALEPAAMASPAPPADPAPPPASPAASSESMPPPPVTPELTVRPSGPPPAAPAPRQNSSTAETGGKVVEKLFLDLDGKPAIHKDGYAGWKSRLDAQGREIERTYIDTNGNPVADSTGVICWRKEFDEWGDEVKRSFLDPAGELTLIKEGIAGWTAEFDSRGNLIKGRCFGVDGEPILHRDGYASWTARFDAQGRETERSYFGLNGEPVITRLGLHRRTAKFDDQGNETESARFGTSGDPVINKNGYHRVRTSFNAKGQKVEQSWFGLDDKPVVNSDPAYGAARYRWDYNARGEIIETLRFGTNGKPMNGPGGWAKEIREYEPDTGLLLFISRFDRMGSPVEDE